MAADLGTFGRYAGEVFLDVDVGLGVGEVTPVQLRVAGLDLRGGKEAGAGDPLGVHQKPVLTCVVLTVRSAAG